MLDMLDLLKKNKLEPYESDILTVMEICEQHSRYQDIHLIYKRHMTEFRKGVIPEKPNMDIFKCALRTYTYLRDFGCAKAAFLHATKMSGFKVDSDIILYFLKSCAAARPPRFTTAKTLLKVCFIYVGVFGEREGVAV